MSTAEAFVDAADGRARHDFDFLSPERQQKFDLLVHLLANLPRPLLIVGPDGIGKSTLLQRLRETAPETWQVCLLDGGEAPSFEALERQLADRLGLADPGGLDPVLAQRQDDALVILALDDAGALLPGGLEAVGRLVARYPVLRLVAALRPDDLHVKTVTDAWVVEEGHVLELPPLDAVQTRRYIHSLWSRSGQGEVDEALAQEVYRRSHGIPARIRQETLARMGRPPLRWHRRLARPVHLALALVLALAVGLTYWQQRRAPVRIATETPPSPSPANSAVELAPPPSPAVADSPPVADTSPPAKAVSPAGVTAAPDTGPSAPPETAPPVAGEDEPDTGPAPVPPVPAAPAPAATEAAAATEAPPVTPVEVLASLGVNDEAWLLRQPGAHFTLQIAAFDKPEDLVAFVRKHPDLTPLAYYRKQRRGRDWYPLLYGVFPTLAAAREAQAGLPADLGRPWLRRLRSVQKDIRAAESSQP